MNKKFTIIALTAIIVLSMTVGCKKESEATSDLQKTKLSTHAYARDNVDIDDWHLLIVSGIFTEQEIPDCVTSQSICHMYVVTGTTYDHSAPHNDDEHLGNMWVEHGHLVVQFCKADLGDMASMFSEGYCTIEDDGIIPASSVSSLGFTEGYKINAGSYPYEETSLSYIVTF